MINIKQEFILEIIKNYIDSLETNLDYLSQLDQKKTSDKHNAGMLVLVQKGLAMLKNTDENNLGQDLEFIGRKLEKYSIPFAILYGKALIRIGAAINQKQALNYDDLRSITNGILNNLKEEKDNSVMDSTRFWEGFLRSILKGEEENLSLTQSIRKGIKENHWPMTRSEITIDEHVIFFCTRLAMTTYLNNT